MIGKTTIKTMDGRISMYVLLMCVWCSLDAGGLLMVVTAQPTVYTVILTPEADRKEGGQVDMRCIATNLESDHIVVWETENPTVTLRWDVNTFTIEPRFMFTTHENVITWTTVQDFTITNVQRADSNDYICNIHGLIPSGVTNIIATSSVTLSVLYFPNDTFPSCSPAGPITIDDGTQLTLRCSSESSHRTVIMKINPTIHNDRYTVLTSQILNDEDTLIRTLGLTLSSADNNVAFECVITSACFPNMRRSCTMGPITVRQPMAEPTTQSMTVSVIGPMISPTTKPTSIPSTKHGNITLYSSPNTQPASNTQPSIATSAPITMSSITPSAPSTMSAITPSAPSTMSRITPSASSGLLLSASSPYSPVVIAGAVVAGAAVVILIKFLIVVWRKCASRNLDSKSPISTPAINPTYPDLTNSQVGLNDYEGLHPMQQNPENSNQYAIQQGPARLIAIDESYISGAETSYTLPVLRAQEPNPSSIYAKPYHTKTDNNQSATQQSTSGKVAINGSPMSKADTCHSGTMSVKKPEAVNPSPIYDHIKTHKTKHDTRRHQLDQAYDCPTEQRYGNPVFDSNIKPTLSRKPKPIDPKPTSKTPNHPDHEIKPQAPPYPHPIHPNVSTPTQEEAHSPPNEAVSSQVSVLKRYGSRGKPGSKDHVLGHRPVSPSKTVMFATVKTK